MLQSLVVLAKEFPGNGTPLDLAKKYQWLPEQFFEENPPEERGLIELLALSEYNRREKERQEKDKADREDRQNMPGLARRLTINQLAERQARQK